MDEIIEIVDIKTYCHGKTAAVDLSMWFHNIGKRPDGKIAERTMLHDAQCLQPAPMHCCAEGVEGHHLRAWVEATFRAGATAGTA